MAQMAKALKKDLEKLTVSTPLKPLLYYDRRLIMFWNDKYLPLSTYNGEVARGILHTKEYKDKMQLLQDEFFVEQKEWAINKGWIVI